MPHNLEDINVLTLVDLLEGNQVDPEAVIESLEFICINAGFDCGMIYEQRYAEELSLMEYYTTYSESPRKSFDIQEFGEDMRARMAKGRVIFMERESAVSEDEIDLLDKCSARSLVLAPIADEYLYVYGFVVLLNKTGRELSSEKGRKILSALLSLIVRYLGMRMNKKKLEQATNALGSVLDNTGIDIYVNEYYDHDILYVNKSMAAPYGGMEQFRNKKCWQVLFPGQDGPCEFCPKDKLINEEGLPNKVYSWDYQRAFDGSWFRVFSAAFPWVDGRLAHIISSADITDNKRNEALINKLANYDHLTGLPNRRMLVQECERRIEEATASEQGYLLFFDIDGFKAINDNFGHDAGDEFLIQLGAFFSEIPLLKDQIYRNGGDEFVALIGGKDVTKDNIRSLCSFIHARFDKVWKLEKGEARCHTSIGVACYPEDGKTAEKLLQKADMAMYKAKKLGGAKMCFAYQLDEVSH